MAEEEIDKSVQNRKENKEKMRNILNLQIRGG